MGKPLRHGAVLVCLLLAPRAAFADDKADAADEVWQKDLPSIATAFDFVKDLDSIEELEVSCGDRPDATVGEEAITQFTMACTATGAEADPARCRTAAILALAFNRMDTLIEGDERGFTFEVTCGDTVLTGAWNLYTPNGYLAENGMLTATERDGADSGGSYSVQVPWQKLAPDPTWPEQYWRAVSLPVREVAASIDRLETRAIAGPLGEYDAGLSTVAQEAADAISNVKDFPEFPDDDSVRTALIAWLTAAAADLDHGPLKLIVDRSTHEHPTKSYKRKTKAIVAREKKASGKRDDKLDKVVAVFTRKHPDPAPAP